MTKKKRASLRDAVAAAAPSTRKGRQSQINTIPGLRADLEGAIQGLLTRPPQQRLSTRDLWNMTREAYPDLTLCYEAFARYVAVHFRYHGQQ